MRDFKWSDAEKKVARRAFDAAFERECAAVIQNLKELSTKAEHSESIWVIHDYLTEQRKTISGKYDYRYSQLIIVFGRLLREGWLDDKDLEDLNEEKRQAIHRIASL